MSEGSPSLSLADLDFELPADLIAQRPAEPRDASRLLVVDRHGGGLRDRVFADLPLLLRAGDVVVRNDTRVFPARAFFRRVSGGRVEVLFLRPVDEGGDERWEVLLRGRPRAGEDLTNEVLGSGWVLRCIAPFGDGRWIVENTAARPVLSLLHEAGFTPLPPYITEPLDDADRYQTTYARTSGSAAAPTAGLHFTPTLDHALSDAGIMVEHVTLHVGLGTFRPLREDTLGAAALHGEDFSVEAAVWTRLVAARNEGRRVVGVGTTSLRVLEHLALEEEVRGGLQVTDDGRISGTTSLFIRPGHTFRAVDGLVTNFHLPRTSLLALVMAFCGARETRAVYRHAVRERYRFYSFGDAMLAL